MPFQVSSIITFKTTTAPVATNLVDAPQDLIAGCPVSFTLEAVALGDLTGHTLLWEQLSGATVLWLTPVNQLIVTYDPVTNDDKTFRLWIDKGTPQEAYKDVEVYSSPYGKGVITGDSATGILIYDTQYRYIPPGTGPASIIVHPPIYIIEKLTPVTSPLGEITVNETNYDIYIPTNIDVVPVDIQLIHRNTGVVLPPDGFSYNVYSFHNITDPTQYIVTFVTDDLSMNFRVDLRETPSVEHRNRTLVGGTNYVTDDDDLQTFLSAATGTHFPYFTKHGSVTTKETIGENITISFTSPPVPDFFSFVIDPTNYTLSGTIDDISVSTQGTQIPPYTYTPDPEWTVLNVLVSDPNDQIQTTINNPEQLTITRTLYNGVLVGGE